MARPIVHGPAYSTYTRSVRLTLAEKGVAYDLVEVDLLGGAAKAPAHLARHPFGKVPAFEHDGFALYETDAIMRYVDAAFPGPDLEPADARGRARMAQAIGIIGGYAYPSLIGQIFIQRAVMPMLGNPADEAAIAAALPQAQTSAAALERLLDGHRHLAGDRLSLADLLLIPVYDYVAQTPEGEKLLAAAPDLRRWWEGVRDRESVVKTRAEPRLDPIGPFLNALAMATRQHRHFLDRPLARVLAAVVCLACLAALAYLERGRWRQMASEGGDSPFARCFAERAGQIDQMLADGLIQAAQAKLLKTRAGAMCRAKTAGGAPALPPQ